MLQLNIYFRKVSGHFRTNAMRILFHWFYGLPILNAVLMLLAATVIFLFLRDKIGNTPHWTTGITFLLLCWIAVIILGTLGQRAEGENQSAPILTPFYSYYIALCDGQRELYRSNFMNVVLFYPAGLLSFQLLPKQWHTGRRTVLTVCAFIPVSMCIEYAQYLFGLGLAEIDDVIHNGLGALLGAVAGGIPVLAMIKKQ